MRVAATKSDGQTMRAAPSHKLVIERMSYRYYVEPEETEFLAFTDVSLTIDDGEFVAIVGPSGCGKTTLLNVIAGLLPHEEARPGRQPFNGVSECEPAAMAHRAR